MTLTPQQRKVYSYILHNEGCTTKEIMQGTGVQCPSGRISEIRDFVGIVSIGKRKYEGTRAFELYKVTKPLQEY